MAKRLLGQLISLLLVSVIFSVLLKHFDVSYWVGGLFGIAVQFAGFYAFKAILSTYAALQDKKLENERIKELSYQGLSVACPCYKAVKQFVPIKLNAPNYYKCGDCNKLVGVYVNAETAIVTEPQESSLEAVNSLLSKSVAAATKTV